MTPYLHERFPALRATLPHIALGDGPTPVVELPDGVWVKRDGEFGAGAWGGNKVRKLEWILPDARRAGRRTILTFGGLGTNHGLATALYARDHGLSVALALVDQPVDDHVLHQQERLRRSGATLHLTRTRARTIAAVPWLLARHRRPYILPPGGSSPVGALGYVEAALEIAAQVEGGTLPEPEHVVMAIGTGGTAAGLALGLRIAGLRTRVHGVVVNDGLKLDAKVIAKLARRTAALLSARGAILPPGVAAVIPADLTIVRDHLGPGYGHPTAEAQAAAALVHDRDGIDLDPVYTAKAFAGLLAARACGTLGIGPILFVHTDGPREDA